MRINVCIDITPTPQPSTSPLVMATSVLGAGMLGKLAAQLAPVLLDFIRGGGRAPEPLNLDDLDDCTPREFIEFVPEVPVSEPGMSERVVPPDGVARFIASPPPNGEYDVSSVVIPAHVRGAFWVEAMTVAGEEQLTGRLPGFVFAAGAANMTKLTRSISATSPLVLTVRNSSPVPRVFIATALAAKR